MARKNERGLMLSFKKSGDATRGRWYTRNGGKPVYFGWGNGVSDRDSYQLALDAYRAWQNAQRDRDELETRGPVPSSFGVATWNEAEHALDAWGKSIREANANVAKPGEQSVAKLIQSWLADQKKRNERRHWAQGQRKEGKAVTEGARENLSDGRYSAYVLYGEHFEKNVGEMKWDGTEANCALIIKTYREACETLLHSGKNKPNTFNERMKTVRSFVTWADENYKLDRIPRAITKLLSKFAYVPSAKSIPLDVIKAIWTEADDIMRTYIALALNAGYYSIDIAVLEAGDVQDGRIIRNRNKTGVATNYPLWAVTRQLLKSEGKADGVLLLGVKGKPLVYHTEQTAETKPCRVDAIADRWQRIIKKLRDAKTITEGYTFSNLRDTSTTFVEDTDPSLSDAFTAHKDHRQAKYYIDASQLGSRQQKLDAIVAKLETFYGLTLGAPA